MRVFPLLCSLFSITGALFGQSGPRATEVLILELEKAQFATYAVQPQDDIWLEVEYYTHEGGSLIHEELGERLWWIGEHPLVVLGGSGLPLPPTLKERASAWAEVRFTGELIWQGELAPRREVLTLRDDKDQVVKQLQKGVSIRYSADYLAEVANYMAGNSTLAFIDADVYRVQSQNTIDNRGMRLRGYDNSNTWGFMTGDYLMWTHSRKALRAGGLTTSTPWSPTNLGDYSTGFGLDTRASGTYSMSLGLDTIASGNGAVAMGDDTTASGVNSLAGGQNSTASGDYAVSFGAINIVTANGGTAFGGSNNVSGALGFAGGSANQVSGQTSAAFGFNARALGESSFSAGHFTQSTGDYATSFGRSTKASFGATAIGQYNVDDGSPTSFLAADRLFTIGNGATGLARHNALEVYKSGFLQVFRDVDATGTSPSHYVANFENEEPTQGGDVLALTVQPTDPNAACNFVAFFGGGEAVGAIDGNGLGGVAYKSGSADLAEWFPTATDESLKPADVVSLQDGLVTKTTANASQAFVISTAPFLVGNDRMDEENEGHSLVALIGQVPVHVTGAVTAGDYLVPSGENDGRARRWQPTDGSAPILGIALSDRANDRATVTALVGSQPHIHPVLQQLIKENQQLQRNLASIRTDVDQILARLPNASSDTHLQPRETSK